MNTTRHALYLPLSPAQKYEGKTTIDAFFWRFGDLAQAGAIYAGLNWFDFNIEQFALVNMVLSVFWLGVAWRVSKHYGLKRAAFGNAAPPRLHHRPRDRFLPPGEAFDFELSGNTFALPAEGDVMRISATLEGGEKLPGWMRFAPATLGFQGRPPEDVGAATVVILRATDFDGAWAEGRLLLRHRSPPGEGGS